MLTSSGENARLELFAKAPVLLELCEVSKVTKTKQGWQHHLPAVPVARLLLASIDMTTDWFLPPCFGATEPSKKHRSEFSNRLLEILALVEFSATSPTIIFNLLTQTYMKTDWQCDTQSLTLCCCNERLPQSVRCLALRARAICSAGRPSCRREWRSQASIADFGAHYTPPLKSSDISLLAWPKLMKF